MELGTELEGLCHGKEVLQFVSHKIFFQSLELAFFKGVKIPEVPWALFHSAFQQNSKVGVRGHM